MRKVDKIKIEEIPTLEEEDYNYLEVLGEGGFGLVRKTHNKRTNTFLAFKYYPIKENTDYEEILADILAEDFILKQVDRIQHPKLLRYYGLRRDPKKHNNIVLIMESGITSIGDLIQVGIRFSQEEVLYFLNEVVEQLVLLQAYGVCNRDIKPANIIIIKNGQKEYCYKIADFGIGCIVEMEKKNLISSEQLLSFSMEKKNLISSELLLSFSKPFAAPEVKQIFENCYSRNYYDPYKADVYSLGLSLRRMLDDSRPCNEVNELIEMMMKVKPENRISFAEIQNILQQPKYKQFMKNPINIEKYLKSWMEIKDKKKTTIERMKEHLDNLQLYNEISHYEEAAEYVRLIENTLQQNNELIFEDQKLLAKIYNDLAAFYQEKTHNYEQAEQYYEKSLNIRIKNLGEDHIDTASSYNNLAIFLEKIAHKYDKAEEYYLKGLEISIRVYGKQHPVTASSYINLAMFYKNITQQYEKAEEYYEKSLNIYITAHGEEHADTATCYNNIAVFYKNIAGKYDKAEEYYKKSLKIRVQIFGEWHAATAASYNNLAMLHHQITGSYAKAEQLYEKSLEIYLTIYGESHPDTASSYDNLASLYEAMGKYEKAGDYYEKALKIRVGVLGEKQVDTAASYHHLALFHRNVTNDYEKAEMYFERSLQIRAAIFGEWHPKTAESYLCYGEFLRDVRGESLVGEELIRRANQINKN